MLSEDLNLSMIEPELSDEMIHEDIVVFGLDK